MHKHEDRLPEDVLTVIFRDDSPMINCNDSPTYRSARVFLTDDQRRHLAMQCTGMTSGVPIYEGISQAFIEAFDPTLSPGVSVEKDD